MANPYTPEAAQRRYPGQATLNQPRASGMSQTYGNAPKGGQSYGAYGGTQPSAPGAQQAPDMSVYAAPPATQMWKDRVAANDYEPGDWGKRRVVNQRAYDQSLRQYALDSMAKPEPGGRIGPSLGNGYVDPRIADAFQSPAPQSAQPVRSSQPAAPDIASYSWDAWNNQPWIKDNPSYSWPGQAQPIQAQSQGTPYGAPGGLPDLTGGNYAYATPQNRPAPFTQRFTNFDGTQSEQPDFGRRDAFIQNINDAMLPYYGGKSQGAPQFDFQSMYQKAGDMVSNGWQNPFAQPARPQQPSLEQQLAQYAPQTQYQPPSPSPFPRADDSGYIFPNPAGPQGGRAPMLAGIMSADSYGRPVSPADEAVYGNNPWLVR